MAYEGYTSLRIRADQGIALVTFDHPPINLMDLTMLQDLHRLVGELEADTELRVVVFDSADPDFFIAHADVALLQQLPAVAPPRSEELSFFHALMERFRLLPKATIGKLEGRARGGGSEFLLSLDMRFGALGRAVLAQPEVALGIIPGGGGTQRLPRLIGRARALEVMLSCDDVPADMAERWGYLNRALPPEQLGPFIDRLARRIALFPAEAIARAKQSVEAANLGVREGLLEEAHLFNQAVASPAARDGMATFLTIGGQTRNFELELGGVLP